MGNKLKKSKGFFCLLLPLHLKRTLLYLIFFRTNFNAHFNMNMYVTLSSTCFGPWHTHLQEEQLYKHSVWYPRSTRRLHTIPVYLYLLYLYVFRHRQLVLMVRLILRKRRSWIIGVILTGKAVLLGEAPLTIKNFHWKPCTYWPLIESGPRRWKFHKWHPSKLYIKLQFARQHEKNTKHS